MGFHNNTNTFGLFPSLTTTNGVTATPGLAITSDSKVGIATSAPQEALHVNGNIRLGGPSGTDANSDVHIKSTSQMIVHAAESDTNSQYCFLGLKAGTSTNLGAIEVGGGANTGEKSSYSDVELGGVAHRFEWVLETLENAPLHGTV